MQLTFRMRVVWFSEVICVTEATTLAISSQSLAELRTVLSSDRAPSSSGSSVSLSVWSEKILHEQYMSLRRCRAAWWVERQLDSSGIASANDV